MYAQPDDVAVHLGRPLSSSETSQFALWISWLEGDILRRIPDVAIDPAIANRAIVQSIAAYLDNPTSATQIQVSVDDGSITRTYSSASGRVEILPALWADLGYLEGGGAFSVTPYGAPDTVISDAWL